MRGLAQELRDAIDTEIARLERGGLVRASAELTRRYQSTERVAGQMKDPEMRAAYLAVRLPATFAAVGRVFEEISRLAPQVEIRSMLDLGAGPGTALWAAAEEFPDLARATLVEVDPAWIAMGKKLAGQSSSSAVRDAEWVRHDLRNRFDMARHDLIVISYALGELPESPRTQLLERALGASQGFVVIVEPGTVRGFGVIHEARTAVITSGTGILAPCPHRAACPLAVAGDWCHFSQRVERSSLHRRIKSAELGYEDEKFSYLIADKRGLMEAGGARIVRHPQKHGGHVQLTLCSEEGKETRVITRAQGSDYKVARQAKWGDLWRNEPKNPLPES